MNPRITAAGLVALLATACSAPQEEEKGREGLSPGSSSAHPSAPGESGPTAPTPSGEAEASASALAPSDELPVHPTTLTGEIPRAPMGQPRRSSVLDGAPGRLEDPEHDAVLRGRREVDELVGPELEDGFTHPNELAEAILSWIYYDDAAGMHGLRITREEFDEIFWPEFPQSRPVTNIRSGDAWAFHEANCRDGVNEALGSWGGKSLYLQEVRYTVGRAAYRNFNLYRGVEIVAVTEDGRDVVIDVAPTFAERNGRWKVYTYKS